MLGDARYLWAMRLLPFPPDGCWISLVPSTMVKL